jgi:glyoxylase-like metal-dependent hydrolase (beta-lactamase superfamily II)
MLHYQIIPVTHFEQNCSLVWCDETQEAALIDAGGDMAKLEAAVQARGLTLKALWLTHGHLDHAGAVAPLARKYGIPIIGPHAADQFWIDGMPMQAQMFGFAPTESFTPTQWLHDGDSVQIGHCALQVRHTPGHTPGHVVFYAEDIQRAFVGDVLFAGSIGRTDFPQGNHADLMASISQKLWPMGDATVFIPGHGPESSFGYERQHNPFVRAGSAALE